MTGKIECIAPVGDRCGEGAVWAAAENALYWTDINRFLIHRYDAGAQSVRSWTFGEPVVALALTTRADILLVALGSGLILWEPKHDIRRDQGFKLPGWPRVRLNDGRPDPAGNFWVGSMKNNVEADGEGGEVGKGEGSLFRVPPAGDVTVWRRELGISNTICWSPGGERFYSADTLENEIRVYDYDATDGSIRNERVFFAGFERGFPDGSCVDSEGYLWNCRYGGGCIVRVAPDGRIDRIVDMPVMDITTCTFGGPDLTQLYVTTAAAGRHKGERLAGSLFRIDPGVKGLPENRFRMD